MSRPRGAFYDDLLKAFVTRYGYDLDVEKNVEGGMEGWAPVNRKLGLTADELVVENNWQDAYRKKLRDKLSGWCRNRFLAKKVHGAAIKSILKRMQAIAGGEKRPRRTPDVTLYSSKFYTSKLKAGFDEVWASAKETVPRSHRVSMCQDYMRGCWDKESEEFRQSITEESDAEYASAWAQYRAREELQEHSAEEYHNALETLDEVGIPLADALSERLGMHVMILAVGPVGSQKGEVRLRSIFSDTRGGQTSKMWGEFDRSEFTAAEASITRYGRAFFARDVCRERAWPPLEGADAAGDFSNLLVLEGAGGGGAPAALAPVEAVRGGAPDAPVQEAAARRGPASDAPRSPAHDVSRPATPDVSHPATPDVSRPATPESPCSPTPDPEAHGYGNWTKTQKGAYKLMKGKVWGPKWTELIGAMLAFEESCLWDADGQLRPSHIRPVKFKTWMKEHRTAGDFNKVQAGFGERMLEWWRVVGPMGRNLPKPDGFDEKDAWPARSAWACLRQGGDNGVLLVLLGLTWWGQSIVSAAAGEGLGAGEAALASNKEWQFLLGDVLYALTCITEEVGSAVRVALEHKKADEDALEAWLKGGSKGKRPKDGDAAKAARKAVLAVTKEAKAKEAARARETAPVRPRRKRQVIGRENDAEPEPPAQKAKTTVGEEEEEVVAPPRPKPRPRKRATTTVEGSNTTSAEGRAPAGASAPEDPPPARKEDVEMDVSACGAKQSRAAGEDEDDGDPFAADPMAGMSAEERADYEAEMAMDADADEDGNEEEDDGAEMQED
ncbi:hypothetical protein C8R46DRAFT_1215745 [Mycena filopes]|nr:hypothetical protein C8R46DRAFT_1215745 [Mycena filopes]